MRLKESLQPSRVIDWFTRTYAAPSPVQKAAWPHIERGANILLVSPAGAGKTLAAFVAVLNQLARLHGAAELQNIAYALYVSSLTGISDAIESLVNGPLREIYGDEPPIRVAVRTRNTSQSERQNQLAVPPHILLTTPESLAVLLTEKEWLPHFEQVRWIIVDQIHMLAETKVAAHLGLSMERLEHLVQTAAARRQVDTTQFFKLRVGLVQRIGLSAPAAPLQELAQLLVGTDRACEIVDVTADEQLELRVCSPLGQEPYPEPARTQARLNDELVRLVKENRTTLIYAATRSSAESAAIALRTALPDLAAQIQCYASAEEQTETGEVPVLLRFKRGELRALICSSFAAAMDSGSADAVVMLSPPKSVNGAIRLAIRARRDVRTTLVALNMNDFIECCMTVRRARARQLDPVRLPQAPLEVLAQHLAAMGCIERWSRESALKVVLGAYCYRDLSLQQFNDVLDYLAGGGEALRQQSGAFGKIHLHSDTFETREGRVSRDLLETKGILPSEAMITVRLKGRALGTVEEILVRHLEPGDVFIVAGRPVRLERVTGTECFVSRGDGEAPSIPHSHANRLPLTSTIADEIIRFRSEMRDRFGGKHSPDEPTQWIDEQLDCGPENARLIFLAYSAQHHISEIPGADFLLVEEFVENAADVEGLARSIPRKKQASRAIARHYFFHTLVGRAANAAISRVAALRLSRWSGEKPLAAADDYGFVLTTTPSQSISGAEVLTLLAPANFEGDLRESLSGSNLMKSCFRDAAQIGLMSYERHAGEQKVVRKLQFSSELMFNLLQQHEPDHVLMRQAWRDASSAHLDIDEAVRFLTGAIGKPVHLRTVAQVPPLSFALFAARKTLSAKNPGETPDLLFHLWWKELAVEESS